MSFWRSLFGKKTSQAAEAQAPPPSPPEPAEDDEIEIKGANLFNVQAVGEAHYQDALQQIVGRKTDAGANHLVRATLVYEDTNPYDNQAVAVFISGLKVAYLSRTDARVLRAQMAAAKAPKGWPIRCDAKIVGGWKRKGGTDVGSFGVRLDFTR